MDRTALIEQWGLAGRGLATVPEVARIIKVPVSTVYLWISEGRFPHRTLPNGRLRVAVSDLLAFVEGKPLTDAA